PIVMAVEMPVTDQPVSCDIGRRKTGKENMAPIATQPSRPPAATITQRYGLFMASAGLRARLLRLRAQQDQPWDGFQSPDGMTLTIHGMPNLSTSEPKPGDQKVSPKAITALPPSDSRSNQRRASWMSPVCRVTSKPFLGLSMLVAQATSMSAPISDWSPTSSQQCISQLL